jgi:Holliday junction resolvase RusA-like endonuclease
MEVLIMLYGIIPFQTISVNKMYRNLILPRKDQSGRSIVLNPRTIWNHINVTRVLTGEAKEQKKTIINYIKGSIKPGVPLNFQAEIYGNWYNKNGSIKKKDLDEKLLIDAIFESLPDEVDDSLIFRKEISKVQSDKPKVIFAISELK